MLSLGGVLGSLEKKTYSKGMEKQNKSFPHFQDLMPQ